MSSQRDYTPLDQLLLAFDGGLRAILGRPIGSGRPDPAAEQPEGELSAAQREQSARLMRVNHAGEVAAQGLYQGQALTARQARVRSKLARAAEEENDHLLWCADRIQALGGRPSLLNPLWYAGSVAIGAAAGVAGDRWSLGFLGETERQVIRHLQGHLKHLPEQDRKSRAVLVRMKQDEGRHATTAMNAGGLELPLPVKKLMAWTARVMTRTAYWV